MRGSTILTGGTRGDTTLATAATGGGGAHTGIQTNKEDVPGTRTGEV